MRNLLNRTAREFRKFLGSTGFFNFCPKCGTKLIVSYRHGFYDEEVYICPKGCSLRGNK